MNNGIDEQKGVKKRIENLSGRIGKERNKLVETIDIKKNKIAYLEEELEQKTSALKMLKQKSDDDMDLKTDELRKNRAEKISLMKQITDLRIGLATEISQREAIKEKIRVSMEKKLKEIAKNVEETESNQRTRLKNMIGEYEKIKLKLENKYSTIESLEIYYKAKNNVDLVIVRLEEKIKSGKIRQNIKIIFERLVIELKQQLINERNSISTTINNLQKEKWDLAEETMKEQVFIDKDDNAALSVEVSTAGVINRDASARVKYFARRMGEERATIEMKLKGNQEDLEKARTDIDFKKKELAEKKSQYELEISQLKKEMSEIEIAYEITIKKMNKEQNIEVAALQEKLMSQDKVQNEKYNMEISLMQKKQIALEKEKEEEFSEKEKQYIMNIAQLEKEQMKLRFEIDSLNRTIQQKDAEVNVLVTRMSTIGKEIIRERETSKDFSIEQEIKELGVIFEKERSLWREKLHEENKKESRGDQSE